jgi:hemoglobin
MTQTIPYRSTPVFTNDTLPEALRRAHSTKPGVWGLLKVIKGSVLYVIEESGEGQIVHATQSVVIQPQQLHSVDPQDDMEMQVDFYREAPDT